MIVGEDALAPGAQPFDVAVIGAGVAGLALALRLDGTGLRVLLVEAGGETPTRRGRRDLAGTVEPGSPQPRLDLFRVRALGGTSRIWGGRCIPYDPIDFAARDWVQNSGWPIPYEAVAAYYPDAMAFAEAGTGGDDPATVLPGEQAELVAGLDSGVVRTTLERFSCPTDFWKRHRPRLAASRDVHVLPRAQAVRVALAGSGRRVKAIAVVAASGARREVVARAYVLAAGGLETPRLLLASDDVSPGGVGNGRDQVGRYYMSHLCTSWGSVRFAPDRASACGYARDAEGIYVRRRLWLSEAAQRGERLLNITFRTHLPEPADPRHGDPVLSAMFLAKRFVQREYAARFAENPVGVAGHLRHLRNIAGAPHRLLGFAGSWTRDRILAERKLPSVVRAAIAGRHVLEFHAEQSPEPTSRVTLGRERDGCGVRRLHVDWRVAEADLDALRRSYVVLAEAFRRTGAGRVDVDLDGLAERVRRHGIAGGHHIGTTRMSRDPCGGVVDGSCRVHGIANLWIAGPSVLPTSGQANPTITFVSLALRLADALRATLSERHGTLAPDTRETVFA